MKSEKEKMEVCIYCGNLLQHDRRIVMGWQLCQYCNHTYFIEGQTITFKPFEPCQTQTPCSSFTCYHKLTDNK